MDASIEEQVMRMENDPDPVGWFFAKKAYSGPIPEVIDIAGNEMTPK